MRNSNPGQNNTVIFGFHIDANPSNVDVRVMHDGQLVGESTLNVTYDRIRPNGEACDPECHVAAQTISFQR